MPNDVQSWQSYHIIVNILFKMSIFPVIGKSSAERGVDVSSVKGNTTGLELSNWNHQYVIQQIIRKGSIVQRGTIQSKLNVGYSSFPLHII